MSDPINDATAYDVRIVETEIAPGETYWKVIRVHHLTPQENNGKHHIFVDVIDEAGNRIYNSRVRIAWAGDSDIIIVDKPLDEPGANYPMWKWQICSAEVVGAPSDRVENLSSGSPRRTAGQHPFPPFLRDRLPARGGGSARL